jgi:hypothetical protein
LILNFFLDVQNYIALHAQIYLIANGLGGWQAQDSNFPDLLRVQISNEKIRQSTALPAL